MLTSLGCLIAKKKRMPRPVPIEPGGARASIP
jgi:hypothetical protein